MNNESDWQREEKICSRQSGRGWTDGQTEHYRSPTEWTPDKTLKWTVQTFSDELANHKGLHLLKAFNCKLLNIMLHGLHKEIHFTISNSFQRCEIQT